MPLDPNGMGSHKSSFVNLIVVVDNYSCESFLMACRYEGLVRGAGFERFKLVGNNPMNNFYEIRGNTGAPASL